MRKCKWIFVLILLIGCFCALPVAAADADGTAQPADRSGDMYNFTQLKYYELGLFSDVDENAWYGINRQGVVAYAYAYGFMNGSGGKFMPRKTLTVAEALAMACRVHDIYYGGSGNFVQGKPWYKVYADYAIANGIIEAGVFKSYTANISRSEMAYIFSRCLPEQEYRLVTYLEPPDVDSATRFQAEIVKLYHAGILTGSDNYATFHPGNSIIRSEAAAILVRVALPGLRIY